jgi:hypothetical protein
MKLLAAGLWLLFLVAPVLGAVVGYRRRWDLAWIGGVAGLVFYGASWPASDGSIAGTGDFSWKILCVMLAIGFLVLFYVSMVLGAGMWQIVSRVRGRASRRAWQPGEQAR